MDQRGWTDRLGKAAGWFADGVANLAHKARTSLRYRLVLLIMAAICIGVTMIGIFTYQAARVSLYQQLDLELTSIAEQTAAQLAVDLTTNPVANADSLSAENVVVMLLGANTNETTLLGGDNPLILTSTEIAVARVQAGSSARDGLRQDGVEYRIVAVPFTVGPQQTPYALVLGRELGPTTRGLWSIAILQWVISVLTVLVCYVIAVAVARATLKPITQLTSAVTQMTETDDVAPILVHGDSEVADLERSFNSLVVSLQNSRESQSRLIADASHELRTPLTSLRTNIELLIADDTAKMLPKSARSEILSDVADQLGEFTALVTDLVALSRNDLPRTNLSTLDVSDVTLRAIERARRRGPGLTFASNLTPTYVRGDAALLERAITNLLDNAVKFSPAGGTITITLSSGELVITDEGPGISDADMPHVFERFYRSDSSRNTPGTGLGLSIVHHTVTAHNGTVSVGRAPTGGAMFVVALPEVEPSDED